MSKKHSGSVFLKCFKGKKISFSGVFELRTWEGSPDLALSALLFGVWGMKWCHPAFFTLLLLVLPYPRLHGGLSLYHASALFVLLLRQWAYEFLSIPGRSSSSLHFLSASWGAAECIGPPQVQREHLAAMPIRKADVGDAKHPRYIMLLAFLQDNVVHVLSENFSWAFYKFLGRNTWLLRNVIKLHASAEY